jgi:hypothetical protein
MKKIVIIFVLLISAVALFGQTKDVYTLDNAISEATVYLNNRIGDGTKVAVLNMKASTEISNYIITELTNSLVNNTHFDIVDRSDLALIQKEMDFQLSGEVSDDSAQSIGDKLGAQTIISGSFDVFGDLYRLSIKALNVATAKTQGIQTYTVKKDSVLSALLPRVPDTVGQKIGTGALNIVFGLGSYLKGDVWGGATITAGYSAAASLFIVEAAALDWNSPAVGVPATIGVAAAGLTLVYGFVRPFIYSRSPAVAALLDNVKLDIVPTFDNRNKLFGNTAVRLLYAIKF